MMLSYIENDWFRPQNLKILKNSGLGSSSMQSKTEYKLPIYFNKR